MQRPAFSKRDELALFLIGTFVATGVLVGSARLFGLRYEDAGALFLGIGAMMLPAIVAVAVRTLVLGKSLSELGLRPRFGIWYLVALWLPAFVALATLGFSSIFSGVSLDLDLSRQIAEAERTNAPSLASLRALSRLSVPPIAVLLLSALPAGASVNALAALGEELGWRGYLFVAFSGSSFWRRSLTTGLVWGLWHVPLVLVGHNDLGDPLTSLAMTLAFCVAWSPLFELVRARSQTVVTSAIMHGTINATGAFASALTVGGTMLSTSAVGLAGVLGVVVVSAVVLAIDASREDSVVRGRFVAPPELSPPATEETPS
jgi:hypothetical protein